MFIGGKGNLKLFDVKATQIYFKALKFTATVILYL